VSPEDAFLGALRDAYEREGSDFRLALEFFGSTRNMAEELGVSQRTVQRWAAYDAGAGDRQARNPERSPHAGDIRAAADAAREERAIQRLSEAEGFEAEVDVEYEDQDEGSRNARSLSPLDLSQTINLYRSAAPMADVGRAFADALGASYGTLQAGLTIANIEGLTLH
jgi:hypothetical protein